MRKEDFTYNWIPDSFDQFCTASKDGLVGLTIMDDQYSWLRRNISIPKIPILKKFFSSYSPSYEERLLGLMASDESIYEQVQERGIELFLYNNTN